ncbi:interleukin-17 receptor E-like isoform X2 [Acipenser ruthenus]|uniref:interleukin-17 receptor E-like isoform X2 n=1 Tax=Acipenser ruthenus TaxID=7906 RepID=UPI00145BA73B|nr:interleukin-17 receptor E-like isoform X2 [Acipenser ruthenus]
MICQDPYRCKKRDHITSPSCPAALATCKGLYCKSKASLDVFRRPQSFEAQPFQSVNISTVMKCKKERDCLLYLNVNGTLQLDENMQGVEICSLTLSTLRRQCRTVRFKKTESMKLHGQQVHVQYNCFEVGIAQQIIVTLKTIPDGNTQTMEYHVQDCNNGDIRGNIPICIAGKLDYSVDQKEKLVSVHVSEFLEDNDYHLRLCHKWHSCESTGAYVLIKREDPVKKVTLPYSKLVPCLCIEGWSSFPDSSRIQLCPFKKNTEELWSGITYNPISQELVWELACPIEVRVSLCWTTEHIHNCTDLPNSSQTVQNKIKYVGIDSHPRLCVKFTTKSGSWIRCPFANGYFPVWNMKVVLTPDQYQVVITSAMDVVVSLTLCNRTAHSICHPLGKDRVLIHVNKSNPVTANLTREMCQSNICIQGRRVDVKYSIPVQTCELQCSLIVPHSKDGRTFVWVVTLSFAILTVVVVAALVGHVTLTVFQRKNMGLEGSRKVTVQPLKQNAGYPRQPRVSLLYSADDNSHVSLITAFATFLTDLQYCTSLTNLKYKSITQEFLGGPDGVVILVWSKGCNKPVIKNTCNPVLPNAMNSVPLKCVRVDIVTYFRDTVKTSDIPSMFDAIPICKLKEHFTALMKQSWIEPQNAMVHHDLVLSLKGYRSRQSPKQLAIEIQDDSEFEDSVAECPDDEETLLRQKGC